MTRVFFGGIPVGSTWSVSFADDVNYVNGEIKFTIVYADTNKANIVLPVNVAFTVCHGDTLLFEEYVPNEIQDALNYDLAEIEAGH